jgi:hypothetical protein
VKVACVFRSSPAVTPPGFDGPRDQIHLHHHTGAWRSDARQILRFGVANSLTVAMRRGQQRICRNRAAARQPRCLRESRSNSPQVRQRNASRRWRRASARVPNSWFHFQTSRLDNPSGHRSCYENGETRLFRQRLSLEKPGSSHPKSLPSFCRPTIHLAYHRRTGQISIADTQLRTSEQIPHQFHEDQKKIAWQKRLRLEGISYPYR